METASKSKLRLMKDFLSKEKLFVISVLLLFCLIYILNRLYPLYVDDWDYCFTHYGKRISSFYDILETQYDHYFSWGGRTVVHIIAQTLLWMGEGWGDFLNSIAYVVFILLIYSIANQRNKKQSVALLAFIGVLMWFLQSSYSETILWITGSANYLWGTLIILLFLYPYCSFYYKHKGSDGNVKAALFLLAGIVSGWTNENMSVAVIFFILVLFVVMKYEKKKIPVWAKSGLAGVIIGAALLLLAPGNYVRYDAATQDVSVDMWYYLERARDIARTFLRFGLPSVFVYLALFTVFVKLGYNKTKVAEFRLSLLFFVSAVVAIIVMVAAPGFPPRAWFGVITFVIIGASILYISFDFTVPLIRKLNYIALILAVLLFALSYALGVKELNRVHNIMAEREVEIVRQKKEGIEDIVLHGRFEREKGILMVVPKIVDLPEDLSNWRYEFYAKYYGVKSIVILDDREIEEKENK